MANLRYPLTSSGGYDYKGKITFSIASVSGVSPLEAAKSIITAATRTSSTTQAQAAGLYGTGQQTIKNEKPISDTNKGQVSLYLPAGIQFRDGAEYQAVDLGILGGAIEKGAKNGQNIASTVAAAIGSDIGSLVTNIAQGNTDAARLAGVRVANKFGDQVSGGVRSALQVAVNPNSRSLFRSVAVRKFTFAFKMISNSQQEAEEIKEIVKWFRSNMYPEDTTAGVSYAYKFPAPFLIRMAYDNKDVATKLLPCYLEDISVGYNSSTMGMHTDGNFIETDLQVSFVEVRALRKNEIVKENY